MKSGMKINPFFNGDWDYWFKAIYEPEAEHISKTIADIIKLASFIMHDEESNRKIKKKIGKTWEPLFIRDFVRLW